MRFLAHTKRLATALALSALCSACALQTESIDVGNRNLGGDAGAGGQGGHGGVGGSGGVAGMAGAGGSGGMPQPQCTPGTERSSCPGTSCHPELLVCTSMELASRGTCESCYADSNCAEPDHRCVKMWHLEEPFPSEISGFCLKVIQNEPADDCIPPFVFAVYQRSSISGGLSQDYCGIDESKTTCEAVRAFHSDLVCPSGRDDECPEGGICRAVQTLGNRTEYRCTYACEDVWECSDPWTQESCAGFCGG